MKRLDEGTEREVRAKDDAGSVLGPSVYKDEGLVTQRGRCEGMPPRAFLLPVCASVSK